MKRLLLILPTVGVALVGTLMMTTQYWTRQYLEDADVLWHDEECFIMLRLSTIGWSGNGLKALLNMGPPAHVRRDAILFAWTAAGLERYELAGSVARGRLVGFGGALHVEVSQLGGPLPAVWRWSGTKFMQLAETEAEKLRTHFQQNKDVLGEEGWGWHEGVTFMPGAGTFYPIRLERTKLGLKVTRVEKGGRSILVLTGRGSEQLLYDQPERWNRVSREKFLETLDPSDPMVQATRSFENLWGEARAAN